jgi:methionine--tRNA ligase beta chain
MHNADRCDKLGNLVPRAVSLCGGKVPEADFKLAPSLPFDLKQLKTGVREAFEKYRMSEAANQIIGACGATNKWIADLEPWKMKAEDQQPKKQACLRLLLEAVYVLAHFFAPFIPRAGDAIFKKIGTGPKPIGDLKDSFQNLKAGGEVKSDSILFEQMEVKVPDAKAADAKADAKAKAKAKAKGAAPAVDDPDQPLFSKLDVRVGKVVRAWNHPEADRLYCEEIDVGESTGPRQIVSGLREHYTLEQFEGRKLLVVCNMKPSKLKNVMSSGMVLCAKNPEKNVVELLTVPDSCNVGDRVLPEGVPATWQPMDPEAVKKFKIWEQVAEDLKSDAEKVACHSGKPLVTSAGTKFVAPTQAGMSIS